MYKADELMKYEYFQDFSIEYLLDPLTGVVSRGYIMDFAHDLIERNISFSFMIMDIDNFKLVNDYYGHSVGDECLLEIANSLKNAVGEKGVVGRYGGDEFVIIFLGDISYDGQKEFLTELYGEKKVVRRSLCLSSVHIFITATIGTATFPNDAKDFDELFMKCDKALYRGKTKGRNCYIIYVDEKHRNIDPHKSETLSIPEMMIRVNKIFKSKSDNDNKLADIIDYFKTSFGISDAFIMLPNSNVISTINRKQHKIPRLKFEDLEICFNKECENIVANDANEVKIKSPGLNRYLTRRNDQSIIISRISDKQGCYGFIVLLENKIQRIWQEKEYALSIYVANIIPSILKEYKN